MDQNKYISSIRNFECNKCMIDYLECRNKSNRWVRFESLENVIFIKDNEMASEMEHTKNQKLIYSFILVVLVFHFWAKHIYHNILNFWVIIPNSFCATKQSNYNKSRKQLKTKKTFTLRWGNDGLPTAGLAEVQGSGWSFIAYIAALFIYLLFKK